jgi:predicted transcriptional regulator
MALADPLPEPTIRLTKLRVKILSTPMPQYQIAGLAGIHPSIMSKYVRGEKPIIAKHLIILCDLFRCEAEEIIGWVGE